MFYIDNECFSQIFVDWSKTIKIIEKSVEIMAENDFAQPIKPYLRYRDERNRIIAMPAFIGGDINIAGIKWIASFPNNIQKNIPRAHSVIILNNSQTGQPIAIFNTPLLSIIRTSSVTGMIIDYYLKSRQIDRKLNVGIIGFGPIGQYHLSMITHILRDKINRINIYDIRKDIFSSILIEENPLVKIVNTWKESFIDSDIFITCTVSTKPYINITPKKGSLLLNISLRDYKTDFYKYVKNSIIVDDWDEVCRENTDIENMHKEKGLKKQDVLTIVDVVKNNCLKNYNNETPIMFNPMGMGVFDIAISKYFLDIAIQKNIFKEL
jgi:ornithine cyclodeaminase